MFRLQKISFCLMLCLLASCASAQLPPVLTVPFASQKGVAWVLLPVKMKDNVTRLFILDSGTFVSSIDSDLAKELGLEVKKTKYPKSNDYFKYVNCDVKIAGIMDADQKRLEVLDMKQVRALTPDIAGILGTDIWKDFALRFDFSKQQLSLMAGGIAGTENEPAQAVRIPLVKHEDDRYYAAASLDGNPVTMLLDTGADQSGIGSKTLAGKLKPVRTYAGENTFVQSDSGEGMQSTKTRLLRLHSLQVGTAEWKDPVIEQLLGLRRTRPERLGLDFFKRYQAVLDFSGKMLYLTPDPNFKETETWVGVGISCKGTLSELHVSAVQEKSPAAKAGVKPDDEIVQIDGHLVSSLTMGQFDELLAKKEGEELTLQVRRASKEKLLTFKMKAVKLL